MLPATRDAVRAILRADASISPPERSRLLALLSSPTGPVQAARLLRRGEAALRLGLSLRALDRLCRAGTLAKCRLPGRVRAAGIPEEQVTALILGSVQGDAA
jgi:hypothetical protein